MLKGTNNPQATHPDQVVVNARWAWDNMDTTITDLAQATGVSRRTMHNWLTKQTRANATPDPDQARRMLR